MSTAVDVASLLDSVPQDPTSALIARWCEAVDGTLEAVERNGIVRPPR